MSKVPIIMTCHFAFFDGLDYYIDANPGICMVPLQETYTRNTDYRAILDALEHNHIEPVTTRVNLDSDITCSELASWMTHKLHFDRLSAIAYVTPAFLVDGELLCISRPDLKVREIVDESCDFLLVMSNMAGEIFQDEDIGLRYFFRSNEQGHNTPHIHVDYRHEAEASIALSTGEVIAGSLPAKALKQAQKRIINNREYLERYWNAHTNGIEADVNLHLGYASIKR